MYSEEQEIFYYDTKYLSYNVYEWQFNICFWCSVHHHPVVRFILMRWVLEVRNV